MSYDIIIIEHDDKLEIRQRSNDSFWKSNYFEKTVSKEDLVKSLTKDLVLIKD